ncbi:DUF4394 domain-containing protein [Streptomyces marianii]|uniref:DUF4394 domain-containing protein n=1 Tax=Streptomyces marianii TaxID=1817406 RepID=A0A5R9EHN4_9ACTN|nr:DUF4394 domain-containing protein [Streptomyces marianii]TLQ47334.1 DUF4394 domain-containing protein [Streptomyces marianii]
MRAAAIALALAASIATAAPAAAVGMEDGGNENGGGSKSLAVTGLTSDQRLVQFRANRPQDVKEIGAVTGLQEDTTLVGIDYRAQDGQLYGVGNAGGVYTIDEQTAAATLLHRLEAPLEGTHFGVDFSASANRLRIVSNTGQNLRHHVEDGNTEVDTDLTLLGVAGAAYTNNDMAPATDTTLFVIDANGDQIGVVSPANTGVLESTGDLGVDAGLPAGFDIYSSAEATNQGFASLHTNGGTTGFYRVDLLTGEATRVGQAFPVQVVDIAVPLTQDQGDGN